MRSIQATVRARHELERERAEAATRMVRALNDADLQQTMTSASEAAWRYREPTLGATSYSAPTPCRWRSAPGPVAPRSVSKMSTTRVRRARPSRCHPRERPRKVPWRTVPGDHRGELVDITTVGTAWCGYQSSQWNGEQGDLAPSSCAPNHRSAATQQRRRQVDL